jgi:hypothetical protein
MRGERGPWRVNSQPARQQHWMLSDRENTHRMRCKLVANDGFNRHDDASRLRDNLALDSVDECRQVLLEESLKNKHFFIQKEIYSGNSFEDDELLTADNETQSLLLEEKEKMFVDFVRVELERVTCVVTV